MSAPPPHTHISTGRTNSELNRVAPGSTSATSGATTPSVSAGKARFQTEATAPSAVDMSTPQQRTRPGSYSCRISGDSRIREHPQRRQPGRLLHYSEVTSSPTAPGGSSWATPTDALKSGPRTRPWNPLGAEAGDETTILGPRPPSGLDAPEQGPGAALDGDARYLRRRV